MIYGSEMRKFGKVARRSLLFFICLFYLMITACGENGHVFTNGYTIMHIALKAEDNTLFADLIPPPTLTPYPASDENNYSIVSLTILTLGCGSPDEIGSSLAWRVWVSASSDPLLFLSAGRKSQFHETNFLLFQIVLWA